jgi:hypothetical protein
MKKFGLSCRTSSPPGAAILVCPPLVCSPWGDAVRLAGGLPIASHAATATAEHELSLVVESTADRISNLRAMRTPKERS